MGGIVTIDDGSYSTVYTTVDATAEATTTLYAPLVDAEVSSVHLDNPAPNADLVLEVTDGASTGTLRDPGVGDSIEFDGRLLLEGESDRLQITVETAGNTGVGVALVSRRETI